MSGSASSTVMMNQTRLSQLREFYDVLYCDVWGVIRDGRDLLPDAVEALVEFRKSGGRVCLVSNSPRRSSSLKHMLANMGLTGDAYDEAVTSGDAIHDELALRSPGKVFRIGPDMDDSLYQDVELDFVGIDDADFISCTGPDDYWDGKPEDYRAVLETSLARGLDLVCANPDIVVQAGDRLIYCAGAIARLYENMGGKSIVAGKPHAPIYDLARKAMEVNGPLSETRILAIGDGPETDLNGAKRAGIDALFIADGILKSKEGGEGFDPQHTLKMLTEYGAIAKWIAPRLIW